MMRKTAAITAASIAGVILAGGAAVGANIGILSAADDSDLGNLSAEAAVASPVSTTEAGTPSMAIVESQTPTDTSQSFTVDAAGAIDVDTSDSGLYISDVRTNPGWTWQEQTTSDGTVRGSFTSGDDELVFTAASNPDGTISASVDRPAPAVTPTQKPATAAVPGGNGPTYVDDDHDEYEDDDHDEYEDDDHDEYEGRDDDD